MKRKPVLFGILALIVLAGAGIGTYYAYQGSYYVKTEDARIAGDIYRVMPRIAAKINSLSVKTGDTVVADQIIGQQDMTSLPANMLDEAALRAPISGTVIQTSAKVGEVVSPGQSVAMIVDKNALYVTANVEETDINRVKIGQPADFTVDSYPGHTLTGKVVEIADAANSTFSLLPTISTSGTFTKVTQRFEVKIAIDDKQGLDLSPGMNVYVKIHVKGNRG